MDPFVLSYSPTDDLVADTLSKTLPSSKVRSGQTLRGPVLWERYNLWSKPIRSIVDMFWNRGYVTDTMCTVISPSDSELSISEILSIYFLPGLEFGTLISTKSSYLGYSTSGLEPSSLGVMGISLSLMPPCMEHRNDKLTEEQRRTYAAETYNNARWISKIAASYSSYTLTAADRAPVSLYHALSDIGQFAEVVYSRVPIDLLFKHLTLLRQPEFPLETYDALDNAVLVDSFCGKLTGLRVFVACRPLLGQLVVAVCGTSSTKQLLQDLRVGRCSHPSGRGTVHTGFLTLYQDIKAQAITGIKKGVADHLVKEIVLTGHSMGGSIAYLLCLDLFANHQTWLKELNIHIKVAAFGPPRAGDAALVGYFQELAFSYRQLLGQDAFKDYCVKGYNDGVPALPPARLGYRHFCKEPLYAVGGVLYNTPAAESEHSLFRVKDEGDDHAGHAKVFPLGGHNYYNGRDLERFGRRIRWLIKANPMGEEWEDRYTAIVSRFK